MNGKDKVNEYWTQSRLELKAWFQRHAPSLGELYEGALKMIFSDCFPGRSRFISHAVREIRNRLPEVVTGSKGSYFDWKGRLDDLTKDWKMAGFSLDGTIPTAMILEQGLPSADISMPRLLTQKIALLLKEHSEVRETSKEAAIRLFMGVSPGNDKFIDSLRPQALQWFDITEWFMKKTHDSSVVDNDFDIQEFRKYFDIFELSLGALLNGFFKTKEGLDAILEDTNCPTS